MSRRLGRSHSKVFLVCSIVAISVTGVGLQLADEDTAGLLSDILNPSFAVLSILLAFMLYRQNNKTPFRAIGPGLVLFLVLLALGEVTWAFYAEILGEVPDVSVADVFWLSGYMVLIFLMGKLIIDSHMPFSRLMIAAQTTYWAAMLPLLAYVLIASVGSPDLATTEKVVWNLYTLADAVILSELITLLSLHRRGQLESCWTFVALSMTLMTVGDMLYTVYDAAGTYYTGSLPDAFYVSSYVIMSLGFGTLVAQRVKFTTILPTTEGRIPEAQNTALSPRQTYLVWGNNTSKAYELMMSGIASGLRGMIVSRRPPARLREEYQLKQTPMIWLSTSTGENAIHPSNLGILADSITRFIERSPDTVVLLDGFEALVTYTDFRKAVLALSHLEDVVMANESMLIVPVDRRALSEKEASLVEKRAVIVEG